MSCTSTAAGNGSPSASTDLIVTIFHTYKVRLSGEQAEYIRAMAKRQPYTSHSLCAWVVYDFTWLFNSSLDQCPHYGANIRRAP